MRILYAVAGEGMGHAFRSKVVIDHLLENKHEVKIVSSGRAFDFLSSQYPLVEDIHHIHIAYEKNKVKNLKTIYQNVRGLSKGTRKSFKKLHKICKTFKPDLIITDFEPFSDWIAKWFRIPIIAIDNINMLVKGKIKVPKTSLLWYVIARLISRTFIFMAEYYVIPTFFHVQVKDKKTHLVPPILRAEVLKLKSIERDHVLVYQTAVISEDAINTLKNIPKQKFIIYGWKEEKKEGNLEFKAFSEQGFLEDLRTCKAVITNGGFTLMGEAIYLGKPILSIPVRRQFEQIMNALYVEKEGYGMYLKSFNFVGIRRFLSGLSRYKRKLSSYNQKGNEEFFKLLDKMLVDVVNR